MPREGYIGINIWPETQELLKRIQQHQGRRIADIVDLALTEYWRTRQPKARAVVDPTREEPPNAKS